MRGPGFYPQPPHQTHWPSTRHQEAHARDAKAAAAQVCRLDSDEVSQSYLLQTRSGLFTGHTLSWCAARAPVQSLWEQEKACRRAHSWQTSLHVCRLSAFLSSQLLTHTPSSVTVSSSLLGTLCVLWALLLPSPGAACATRLCYVPRFPKHQGLSEPQWHLVRAPSHM